MADHVTILCRMQNAATSLSSPSRTPTLTNVTQVAIFFIALSTIKKHYTSSFKVHLYPDYIHLRGSKD